MFIEMWFFLAVYKGVPSDVGPFKNERQCQDAQKKVEESGFQVILPCWKAQ